MKKRNLKSKLALAAACALFGAVGAGAEVIKNPPLEVDNLGTNPAQVHPFTWKSKATSMGAYEGSVYTLTGNGHDIYMCWDRAAVAYIYKTTAKELTFQARLLDIVGDTTKGGAGIWIKPGADGKSPVVVLRWDTYWKQAAWFNRTTDSSAIGACSNCEKGDRIGQNPPQDWEGCLGKGFENQLPTFNQRKNLWMKLHRKGATIRLFLKKDADKEWTEVQPISNGTTWRAITPGVMGKIPPHPLPGGFTIPQIVNDTVNVGLFVTHSSEGVQEQSAKFDNIEYATGSSVSVTPASARFGGLARSGSGEGYRAFASEGGIRFARPLPLLADRLVSAELTAPNGKSVKLNAQLASNGQDYFLPTSGLTSGLYFLRVKTEVREMVLPVALTQGK